MIPWRSVSFYLHMEFQWDEMAKSHFSFCFYWEVSTVMIVRYQLHTKCSHSVFICTY